MVRLEAFTERCVCSRARARVGGGGGGLWQVATGLPPAYDGRWGEQFGRDAGGASPPLAQLPLFQSVSLSVRLSVHTRACPFACRRGGAPLAPRLALSDSVCFWLAVCLSARLYVCL